MVCTISNLLQLAMSSGPAGSPAPGARERMGSVVSGKKPKGITSDMFKPYLFGNHQSVFKLFNVLVGVGTVLCNYVHLVYCLTGFQVLAITWCSCMTLDQRDTSFLGYEIPLDHTYLSRHLHGW